MIGQIYTGEQIATEVCDAFGSSDPASFDRAYRSINRALRTISRKGSWPFLKIEDLELITASGQESYRIKQKIQRPKFLHLRDPARKLVMLDLRTLRTRYPNNTETTGVPLFWREKNYSEGSQTYEIALWPIPDGVYTIYIDADRIPPQLQNKNDDIRSLGFPEEMIETIIHLAIAYMYEKSHDSLHAEKFAVAMQMVDDDFYRMTNSIDEALRAREYSGTYDLRSDDPVLNGNYDGV